MSNQKEIEQALQVLLKNNVIYKEAGKWRWNDPVISSLDDLSANLPVAIAKQELVLPATAQEWELQFMNLISNAKVPAKLEDNRGGLYYANKFSVDALKVFKKALMDGVIYEVLVKSVMLYYKSNVRYKKAIGNYFIQGDWKSDYEALLSSAETGADALKNHIKSETEDGNRSQFKLG